MMSAVSVLRRGAATIDAPVLAILVIFVLLALLAPDQALDSARSVTRNMVLLSPFLVVAVAAAAYASASGADNLIARAFQGRTAQMVVLAALFGALSPFCSCGVIPLIAALLAVGVPLAPVMAFWLASPIMDPTMFALTVGVLGTDFALAKTLAAFGLGLFGGFGIWALMRLGVIGEPLHPGFAASTCAANRLRNPDAVVWRFWQEPARIDRFANSAGATLGFLAKWLTLAFLLQALMLAYIPGETITALLGGTGLGAVGLATIVGVPAYLNGYAALPLVSALFEQGMAPGAGMAFLVAGGVTSVPAAIAVFALARLPVFLAYVAFALTGALFSGVIYGLIA